MSDYYTGLNQELLNMLPDAHRVLEVGCANGLLGEAYKRTHSMTRWTGVENHRPAVLEAQKRLDEVIPLNVEKAYDLKFGEPFDVVVFGDLIEHLLDQESFLNFLHRVSTPDATLVCCVPNMGHLSVIEQMLAGDLRYSDSGLLDRTHLRFMTPSSTIKLLLDSGWLPHLEGTNYTQGGDSVYFEHFVQAAKLQGIARSTVERNLLAFQLYFKCVKSPLVVQGSSHPFSVIVPVTNQRQFEHNVLSSPGLKEVGAQIIPIENAADAADAFDRGNKKAVHLWRVYCHQDVYFPKGSGRALSSALWKRPLTSLVGFAGVGFNGHHVNFSGLVIDRVGRFDFPATETALAVDEFAVALSAESSHKLDTDMGWHLWGTDLCLAAKRDGTETCIERVPLYHNSYSENYTPETRQASIDVLRRKYPNWGKIPTISGDLVL